MSSLKLSAPEPGHDRLPPLVILLGPTSVGKTELSLRLAEELPVEIISADSRLFYRGMDIGTAKPSKDELSRVAHHLIDVAEPDETWSLPRFLDRAEEVIHDIYSRNRLPLLVGGTGQYVRAITQGWAPPAVKPNPRLRQVLEEWGLEVTAEGLHARLRQVDPEAADKIDPRNLRRTIRALEVIFTTGKRFSRERSRQSTRFKILQIGLILPRKTLYDRIDQRIESMLAAGFYEEVNQLLQKGYSSELASMTALGYQEMIRCIKGEISLEEAKRLIRRRTRTYVRRQANWFKPDDPSIHWFSNTAEVSTDIINLIVTWLENEGYI